MNQDSHTFLHHLVQLTAYVCHTPTALISISEGFASQFLISFGWDAANWQENLPFYQDICATPSIFAIEDAKIHPRFAEHPLVREFPYIRFYAGVPLIATQGTIIGVLCIIDYIPHVLNSEQKQIIKLLAQQAIAQLTTSSYLYETTSQLETIKEQSQALLYKHQLLQERIKELEQQNVVNQLLNQLGISLLACTSLEEAHQVAASLLSQLFPSYLGNIFIAADLQHDNAKLFLEWGDESFPQKLQEISLKDCRTIEANLLENPLIATKVNNSCLCFSEELPAKVHQRFCFPLKDEDNVLGILHLYGVTQHLLTSTQYQLIEKVINQLTLAFKNLKLLNTLKLQSIRDSLTGLFNRRYFNEILERLLSRGINRNYLVSLIIFDIDHFKHLNDTFGHQAGDKVLQDLSIFVKGHIRPNDIACRYGGEEFAIILPECSLKVAAQRAEKLRRGFQYLAMQYQGQLLGKITISLGVAAFPQNASNTETLVQSADAALYCAKNSGRNRVCVAD